MLAEPLHALMAETADFTDVPLNNTLGLWQSCRLRARLLDHTIAEGTSTSGGRP
jgi:hypothetical protein